MASLAVDGSTDGSFYDGHLSHTDSATYAWWQVDLGPQVTVNSVVIWNRTDCCGYRLSDYWVFISITCDTEVALSSGLAAASCASTDAQSSPNAGSYTVYLTATGTNGNSANQVTASATVAVGLAPKLNAVTDASNGTIHAGDYIVLWGDGFADEKQNVIECTQRGNAVFFDDSDGVGLYYESHTQINVNLANRLAPGTWSLVVWNGWSGNSSNSYQITVYQ